LICITNSEILKNKRDEPTRDVQNYEQPRSKFKFGPALSLGTKA